MIRPHHLAAPALVAAIAAMAALAATGRGRRLAAGGALAYVTACVVAAQRAGAGEAVEVRRRVPGTFAVMHVAWGLGFWAGVWESVRGAETGGGSPPRLSLPSPDS